MSNDFYEDDEPAEEIHRLFDDATEYGLTEPPWPGGARIVTPSPTATLSTTVAVSRTYAGAA